MDFFNSTTPYKDQKYSKLKSKHVEGNLFVDPEFPAQGSSINHSSAAPRDIVWKRPGEIATHPKLFVDGAGADDFEQGELGNCWFVAACASLAGTKKLIKKIVPEWEKQEWTDDNKYGGIFHFRFYRLGVWYDLVIDDLLPTRGGELVFVHSKTPNEFWSALLEKAYAKFYGSYESLKGGNAEYALVDMMGGVCERMSLQEYKDPADRERLWHVMHSSKDNDSLMSASIHIDGDEEMEKKLETGLVAKHAYSVTAVSEVRLGKGLVSFFKRDKVRLLRLRNPWGEKEWNGAWSDNSPEWKKISKGEKKDLGLVIKDDGEFWMAYDDFLKNYTSLGICHVISTGFMTAFNPMKTKWQESSCTGEWKVPNRAGGCANHDTFLQNPQFRFNVTKARDEVVVSLEQEDARIWKGAERKNACIGVALYRTDVNRKHRMHDLYGGDIKDDGKSYSYTRSALRRLTLTEGRYLAVPTSFDPGHEGVFHMRVFSDAGDPHLRELTQDAPDKSGGRLFGSKPKHATHVTLVGARGLEHQDKEGGADPYCKVSCEKDEVTTPTAYDTLNPDWRWRVVLYKEHSNSDVTIEVWNRNKFKDKFMGRVILKGGSADSKNEEQQSLSLAGKHSSDRKPGQITIKVKHFDRMEAA